MKAHTIIHTSRPARIAGSLSAAWLERMRVVTPRGVSSNVREAQGIVASHASGAELFDVDGRRYLDYLLGYGPALLGHGHEAVAEAVSRAVARGCTFAMSTEVECRVCEQIVALVPSVEQVRLCNSGTDAATTAYRLAVACTGANGVVKIQGDYNGGFDPLMFDITGVAAERLGALNPASVGLLPGVQHLASTVPFNDVDALEAVLDSGVGRIAAVFLEPILGNAAGLMPQPGYLERVRRLCSDRGVVLVFDEVKTGFRVHPAGAQGLFGVMPDLTMLGKALGNGLPIAAIGGRADVMQHLRLGDVHHCGTYYGNAASVAAADTVLSLLPTLDYDVLMRRGESLARGICNRLLAHGIVAQWHGVGSMFGITLGEACPHNYAAWHQDTAHEKWEMIADRLIDHGVLSDAYIGLMFLSFAHTDTQVSETLSILDDVLQSGAEA